MVYLLKMVIFHGYVSHNQMVIFGCLPFSGGRWDVYQISCQMRPGGWNPSEKYESQLGMGQN